MTSGRVGETHRTFQDHTLDAFSSSMALRYDGSNVRLVLLLHCFHAVSFPSHGEIGVVSSAVPRSFDDWWLRRNGLAECIAAECGYVLRVGANTHSNLMTSISVPQMMPFVLPKRTVSKGCPLSFLSFHVFDFSCIYNFSISVIKRAHAVVSPPVQMNTYLSTTARALFLSRTLSTKPTITFITGHVFTRQLR